MLPRTSAVPVLGSVLQTALPCPCVKPGRGFFLCRTSFCCLLLSGLIQAYPLGGSPVSSLTFSVHSLDWRGSCVPRWHVNFLCTLITRVMGSHSVKWGMQCGLLSSQAEGLSRGPLLPRPPGQAGPAVLARGWPPPVHLAESQSRQVVDTSLVQIPLPVLSGGLALAYFAAAWHLLPRADRTQRCGSRCCTSWRRMMTACGRAHGAPSPTPWPPARWMRASSSGRNQRMR